MSEVVQIVLIAVGGIFALKSARGQLDRDSIRAYKGRLEEMAARVGELEEQIQEVTRSRNDFADLWADEREARARDAITYRLQLRRLALDANAANPVSTLVALSERESIRHAGRRKGNR